MPIEIRELSIKVNVGDREQPAAGRRRDPDNSQLKARILEECLEQVSEMLKQKKER